MPTGPLDAWHSDPFAPTMRDGYLYGRGAADMKGSLAAFVTAIEGFLAAHPGRARARSRCCSRPTRKARRSTARSRSSSASPPRGERIDYCVVGEPSSVDALGDMIKNGRRGTLSGTLTVKGVQGHIAYPHLARNPIHLVAPALAELAATRWDDGNEYFPPTTWQCSNIHAGTGATNVIPGTLERACSTSATRTESTRESLQQRFEAIAAAARPRLRRRRGPAGASRS